MSEFLQLIARLVDLNVTATVKAKIGDLELEVHLEGKAEGGL